MFHALGSCNYRSGFLAALNALEEPGPDGQSSWCLPGAVSMHFPNINHQFVQLGVAFFQFLGFFFLLGVYFFQF